MDHAAAYKREAEPRAESGALVASKREAEPRTGQGPDYLYYSVHGAVNYVNEAEEE